MSSRQQGGVSSRDLAGSEPEHDIASNVKRSLLETQEAKHVLQTHIGDLFPEGRPHIIEVKTDTPVTKAFQELIDHNVLSLPVYDQKKRQYVGFVDMVDMVHHAVCALQESEIMGGELSQLLESKERFAKQTVETISDLSKRNPWKPVEPEAPLKTAIRLMVKWQVHRIPVLDDEGGLSTLLTQSQVVQFINSHIASFKEIANATVGTLKLGYTAEVVSVDLFSTVLDAFKVMQDKHVSGVAVTEGKNHIVGNISVSDLKLIKYDATLLKRLYLKVDEFLRLIKPNEPYTGAITVTPETTFAQTVAILVEKRIHRVYVVEGEKPIGVISLTEILKAINAGK